MTPRDRESFGRVLSDLGDVFGRQLTPALTELYWDSLRDLALSTVQAMAGSHRRTGKFFPKPFELRPVEYRKSTQPTDMAGITEGAARSTRNLDDLHSSDRARWLAIVSPKVFELGRAKGMTDGLIGEKLAEYRPPAPPGGWGKQ